MDVSELLIGKQLRAGDLPIDPQKMKLLTDPQRVLAHVVILKKEEEPVAEAAVATETAPAEPEVIKKGKKERRGRSRGRRRGGSEGREGREEGQGEVAEAPWARREESSAPMRDSERDVRPV